jgi:formylglycine-generating enzyme required for sulfatase activity/predicted Ser/Thr protein kinase
MSEAGRAERYTDWRRIGEGGMAVVYMVRDTELGLDVAIKVINEEFRKNTKLIDSLRGEVLISRMLRHPSICPIHEIYEGSGGFGIVMDLLRGKDLKAWLKEHNRNLLETLPERVNLLIKVLEGLDVAHKIIIHRDLKPSNIWLKEGNVGDPLILDFGISQTHTNSLNSDLFGDQEILAAGTLQYMPPEQLLKPEVVDNRSDLFSFGIMAYEIMTGGRIPPCSLRAYARDRTVPRINIKAIPPPSTYCAAIPASLDQIILQSLAYHRLDRPQQANDIAEVLRASLGELGSDPTATLTQIDTNLNRPDCVDVPAGSYFIGSLPNSESHNEMPMRRLTMSAYRISKTPITNNQFRQYLDATGANWPELIDDAIFGADDNPVVGLSWLQAREYAKWAGGDLPTEAQWEVAAKAGVDRLEYPWGDEEPGPGKANIDSAVGETTSVHAFPQASNAWGISDMCGNVWEWCRDKWDENYYRSLTNGDEDPVCKTLGDQRSIRGGSFESFPDMGRCSFRHCADMERRGPDLGFRIVFDNTN